MITSEKKEGNEDGSVHVISSEEKGGGGRKCTRDLVRKKERIEEGSVHRIPSEKEKKKKGWGVLG